MSFRASDAGFLHSKSSRRLSASRFRLRAARRCGSGAASRQPRPTELEPGVRWGALQTGMMTFSRPVVPRPAWRQRRLSRQCSCGVQARATLALRLIFWLNRCVQAHGRARGNVHSDLICPFVSFAYVITRASRRQEAITLLCIPIYFSLISFSRYYIKLLYMSQISLAIPAHDNLSAATLLSSGYLPRCRKRSPARHSTNPPHAWCCFWCSRRPLMTLTHLAPALLLASCTVIPPAPSLNR